jgi:outer membrane protein OmpA-like peptidoglycan-associated protein
MMLAATVLALPAGAAMAQVVDGPYVAGGAGYNWTQNIDISSASVTAGGTTYTAYPNNRALSTDGGFVGVGSVGYGFGNGLRVELEGNYRGNNVKAQNGSGSVNVNQYGVFVNGLYDFALDLPVTPYVGAGVGGEWTAVGNHSFGGSVSGTPYSGNIPGATAGSPAVQAIIGAALPVGFPGLSVTAEYRFLATLEKTKYDGTLDVGGNSYGISTKFDEQYNHSFLVGLRYAFNTAPPPPPPAPVPAPVAAPAPAPSRTYLVFFDWDRADLTGRAKQIIAEAAQNSTRVQLTQIEVSGHADRTGTAQYNLALSRKRADNVAAELVRLGVPKNEILIQAFGDTKPLVPTAEGVREPQNRRVEIVLK